MARTATPTKTSSRKGKGTPLPKSKLQTPSGVLAGGAAADADRLPPEVRAYLKKLDGLNVEELFKRMYDKLEAITDAVVEVAAIVYRLEQLGQVVNDVPREYRDHFGWLRKIARGHLEPELMTQFMGTPKLLNKLAKLTEADRKGLLKSPVVKVAKGSGDKFVTEQVKLADLEDKYVEQVFGEALGVARVRTPADQQKWVEANQKRPLPVTPPRRVAADELRPCHDKPGVLVGKKFLEAADIVNTLAACQEGDAPAADPDDDKEVVATIKVTLKRRQQRALAKRASEAGVSVAEMTYRALQTVGLLRE